MTIRKATPDDTAELLKLIDALAEYEKLDPPDDAARERLAGDLNTGRRFDAYFAVQEQRPVGYAIVMETYSSFLALPTLYLEDLFVLPEFRGRGIGSALFDAMAEEARHRGCGRMEWVVLDWNAPAIAFYEKRGASRLVDWLTYRLDLRSS
jgi:GNAT superfamily N-acetyltransferase